MRIDVTQQVIKNPIISYWHNVKIHSARFIDSIDITKLYVQIIYIHVEITLQYQDYT